MSETSCLRLQNKRHADLFSDIPNHRHLNCCREQSVNELLNKPIEKTSDLYMGIPTYDEEQKKINDQDHLCAIRHINDPLHQSNRMKVIHENEKNPCTNCEDATSSTGNIDSYVSRRSARHSTCSTDLESNFHDLEHSHMADEPIIVNDHAACPMQMSRGMSVTDEHQTPNIIFINNVSDENKKGLEASSHKRCLLTQAKHKGVSRSETTHQEYKDVRGINEVFDVSMETSCKKPRYQDDNELNSEMSTK